MNTDSKAGLLDGVNRRIKKFFKDLESESVNKIRSKPVDCCNPPVPSSPRKEQVSEKK